MKNGCATKLGDRRLGFSDDELKTMLADAGLRDSRVGVGARKVGDPFTVLIASGQKPPLADAERRSTGVRLRDASRRRPRVQRQRYRPMTD